MIKEFVRWISFYLAFAAGCVVVFIVGDSAFLLLKASVETPWGVVTAAFVHVSAQHLCVNLLFIFAILFVLFWFNRALPVGWRLDRSEIFIIGFLGSFFAFAGWLVVIWLYNFTEA